MTAVEQRQLEPWQGQIAGGIALLVLAVIAGAMFFLARAHRDAGTVGATALVARLEAGPITEGTAAGATLLQPDAMGGLLAPPGPFLAGYREIRTETEGVAGKKSFDATVDYHTLTPFKLGAITVGPAALDGDLSGCTGKSTEDAHVRIVRSGDHVSALGKVVNGAITDRVELHCGDAASWLAEARAAADQPLPTLGLVAMIVGIVAGLGGALQFMRGVRLRKRR